MIRSLFAILVIGTMFLSGRTSWNSSGGTRQSPPALKGIWSVRLIPSGGFIGIHRQITMVSNGSFTIKDEGTGEQTHGLLTQQQLSDLTGLIASASYTPTEEPHGCADCFIYDMETTGSDQVFPVLLDDISLPESGLWALDFELQALMKGNLN